MKLPPGKVPINVLEEVVFKNLGVKREEIAIRPSAGLDGAVIDVGSKSLIASTDPITGAIERIGWLAVNINANDVATFGVEPSFFFSSILLPHNSDRRTVESICTQIDRAAKKLGMAVAGGHCEVTPSLTNPIVVGCALGVTEKDKYVTAGGAKPTDKLIMTKSAGIEGTAILASDMEEDLEKELETSVLIRAKNFFDQISIVKEAMTATETGGVNAMHDPTEGGVIGGIHEMADASKLGVRVFQENIPIELETFGICEFFQIDPLQLTSSGALLISTKPESAAEIIESLKLKSIRSSIIGEFTEDFNERTLIKTDGNSEILTRPQSDHLWLALSRR